MSMLYLWNPTLLDEGRTLQVMITRGDSDQVANGSTAFLAAILKAVGVKTASKGSTIEQFRCNYYSEYWEEPGWESRWDIVWRCRVKLAAAVAGVKIAGDYVGIDEIDEYSPDLDARKKAPYPGLVVAEFPSEKAAADAAAAIAGDPHLMEARTAPKTTPKSSVFKVAAKRFHLHLSLGSLNVASFEADDSYANAVVERCEELGARVHANQ